MPKPTNAEIRRIWMLDAANLNRAQRALLEQNLDKLREVVTADNPAAVTPGASGAQYPVTPDSSLPQQAQADAADSRRFSQCQAELVIDTDCQV